MAQVTMLETKFDAFAAAITDVLANQLVKLEAVLTVLAKKGSISEIEIIQAMKNIPEEVTQKVTADIGSILRERMAIHYREFIGHGDSVH